MNLVSILFKIMMVGQKGKSPNLYNDNDNDDPPLNEADSDTESDADSDADSDAESEADSDTESDAESEADSDTDGQQINNYTSNMIDITIHSSNTPHITVSNSFPSLTTSMTTQKSSQVKEQDSSIPINSQQTITLLLSTLFSSKYFTTTQTPEIIFNQNQNLIDYINASDSNLTTLNNQNFYDNDNDDNKNSSINPLILGIISSIFSLLIILGFFIYKKKRRNKLSETSETYYIRNSLTFDNNLNITNDTNENSNRFFQNNNYEKLDDFQKHNYSENVYSQIDNQKEDIESTIISDLPLYDNQIVNYYEEPVLLNSNYTSTK